MDLDFGQTQKFLFLFLFLLKGFLIFNFWVCGKAFDLAIWLEIFCLAQLFSSILKNWKKVLTKINFVDPFFWDHISFQEAICNFDCSEYKSCKNNVWDPWTLVNKMNMLVILLKWWFFLLWLGVFLGTYNLLELFGWYAPMEFISLLPV